MKAICLKPQGGESDAGMTELSLEDLPVPEPRAGEVLIQIAACAFNPIDYQMRQARPERNLLRSPVLGRECAGTVVKCAPDVREFSPGDLVHAYVGNLASNGTYAEYVCVPASLLAHVSHRLSLAQAAAMPAAGITAYLCLQRLRLFSPRSLLITGAAGGVGSMLIKLILRQTSIGVVATVGNPASHRKLADLGVLEAHIVNYHEPGLQDMALAGNGGAPFDAAVDLVGGAMSLVCSTLLRREGVYADIANMAAPEARERLFRIGATILNISGYARTLDRDPESHRWYGETLSALNAMVSNRQLSPSPILPLQGLTVENVEFGHRIMRENMAGGSKIVMLI